MNGPISGWYGKVPSLGDFASRRLPPAFVRTWDAWLQDVLHGSRTALGEAWTDGYVTMPIWRFVLLPGAVGDDAWAGVVMPSVDRVGRPFPLTVAVALSSYAEAAHALFHRDDWFARMEDAALSMLDVTRGPDDLDQLLAESPSASVPADMLDGPVGDMRALAAIEGFEIMAQGAALRAWGAHAGWKALWWTRGRVDASPLVLASAGLPTVEEFIGMLHSRPAGRSTVDAVDAAARC